MSRCKTGNLLQINGISQLRCGTPQKLEISDGPTLEAEYGKPLPYQVTISELDQILTHL